MALKSGVKKGPKLNLLRTWVAVQFGIISVSNLKRGQYTIMLLICRPGHWEFAHRVAQKYIR